MKECKGTAVLDAATDTVTAKQGHGHSAQEYGEALTLKNDLKTAVQQDLTSRSNREVFNSLTRHHPQGHKLSFG